jgi:dephospho-CoA kinase
LKARLAITGGIACGKSVVGTLLARRGIPVCDADDLVHEALDSDGGVRAAIEAEFGAGVLREGGMSDRRRLGAIVFRDAAARARLEAILHPPVLRRMRAWVAEELQRHDIVAGIVPLLYEVGEQANWDLVICVTATVEIQRRRLAARGLSEDDAHDRIASQMGTMQKVKRADFVVSNQGTLAMLDEQVDRVLCRIRRELA